MRKPIRKHHSALHGPTLVLFVFFLIVALLTVLALEYIDYHQGRYSFIFSRLFKPKPPAAKSISIQAELVGLLEQSRCEYQHLKDATGIYHFKITATAASWPVLLGRIQDLVKSAGGTLAQADQQREKEGALFLYQISLAEKQAYIFLVSVKEAEKKTAAAEKKMAPTVPRIAIIIDDIGYIPTIADQLHELGIPITAAVIPDAPFAAPQAEKLHRFGLEELIHLPMQSKSSQNHNSDGPLITTQTNPAAIAAMLHHAERLVPYARGVNNHMGSLITSKREWIEKVLLEIKRENLFFIDSRTDADSVACDTAHALEIKTLARDVFLDAVQDYSYSLAQIRVLVELARSRGEATAIGHPLESTLKALRDSLEWIHSQKVKFVFASELLK